MNTKDLASQYVALDAKLADRFTALDDRITVRDDKIAHREDKIADQISDLTRLIAAEASTFSYWQTSFQDKMYAHIAALMKDYKHELEVTVKTIDNWKYFAFYASESRKITWLCLFVVQGICNFVVGKGLSCIPLGLAAGKV